MALEQSEFHETMGSVFGHNNEDEPSLLSHLDFIGKQLERIANALENARDDAVPKKK